MDPETNSWASRRKTLYSSSVILLFTAISFFVFWKFWYRTPTCLDGLQNGGETGVDCGGPCALVCPGAAINPVVRFDPRIFKVSNNLYSVLAFVENYNINSWAPVVPYRFQIYDEKGVIIYERYGTTTLPKAETSAIFEGNIILEGPAPRKVSFELAKEIWWEKSVEDKPKIKITNSPLLRQETSPRIEAEVFNESLENIDNLEFVAVVFDGKDNAIAASRTFVELLKKGQKANIFFTWPKPFDLGERICQKPSDVVLAIDRSGSMASLGKKPPEPLESVKNAALNFVSELGEGDKAALVTFATDSEKSSDSLLAGNFENLRREIKNISILSNGVQYTNISSAIEKSREFFTGDSSGTQKVLVLLTDGVATRPENPAGSKSEEEEIAYAEAEAEKTAAAAKKEGIKIYTIGLGSEIHEDFLKRIATTPESFFLAPATSTLEQVYEDISSDICKELPARIEIKYKVFR